jgi:hypothetical protein
LHGDRPVAQATLHRENLTPPDIADLRGRWSADHVGGEEIPGTATCLACGSTNPLGVGIRFLVNDRFLWRECDPPAPYRLRRGAHPALALILLDELGWWLGALAQRECGVTTEVRITLFESLPPGPLLIVGNRTAVQKDDDPRGRYSRATGAVLGPDGAVLATADVRFGGSRAYTRRLVEPFLRNTPLDELARWFPSARDLARQGPSEQG